MAYQSICNALALSDEIGAHRQVWEMCAALSKLEMERGDEPSAQKLKERSRKEAMRIAEHAGASALNAVFLSREDVQLILDAD